MEIDARGFARFAAKGWTERLLADWLREAVAVAFFNPAHGREQMAVGACPQLLGLAVEVLHHQRIKDADLLQMFQVVVDAGKSCVQTVEKVIEGGFFCAE